MAFVRVAGAGLLLALLAGAVRADATSEFWPELDTWIKLNAATRLLLVTDGTRDRDTGDRVNSEYAGYIDYRFSDRIAFRGGYLYADTPPQAAGQSHGIERRWVLDFTYNWRLDQATKLSNRVRTDLRDTGDGSSYRIRDRLKIEHQTHLGRQAVAPYANLEASYDSRFDTVSRYRLEVGVTTPLSKDVELDFYAGRQRDTQPSGKYANGIGITLSLYL